MQETTGRSKKEKEKEIAYLSWLEEKERNNIQAQTWMVRVEVIVNNNV